MRKEVATGGMKCSTPLRRAWLKKMLGCFESEMKVAADDEVGLGMLAGIRPCACVKCGLPVCKAKERGKEKKKGRDMQVYVRGRSQDEEQ